MLFFLPPAFEQPIVLHAEAQRPAAAGQGSATFEGLTITCSANAVPSIRQETVTTPTAVGPVTLQKGTLTRASCEPVPRAADATEPQGPITMSIDKAPQAKR